MSVQGLNAGPFPCAAGTPLLQAQGWGQQKLAIDWVEALAKLGYIKNNPKLAPPPRSFFKNQLLEAWHYTSRKP
jgi:hypothetical protein